MMYFTITFSITRLTNSRDRHVGTLKTMEDVLMDEDNSEEDSDSESFQLLSSSESCSHIELSPLQGCTSHVWQHFGFPA